MIWWCNTRLLLRRDPHGVHNLVFGSAYWEITAVLRAPCGVGLALSIFRWEALSCYQDIFPKTCWHSHCVENPVKVCWDRAFVSRALWSRNYGEHLARRTVLWCCWTCVSSTVIPSWWGSCVEKLEEPVLVTWYPASKIWSQVLRSSNQLERFQISCWEPDIRC